MFLFNLMRFFFRLAVNTTAALVMILGIVYLFGTLVSVVAGGLEGWKYGCFLRGTPHSFESRIDYVFPLQDLISEHLRKSLRRDPDLCDPPWRKWLMDSVYLDEAMDRYWEEEEERNANRKPPKASP